MRGHVWRGPAAMFVLCALMSAAYGQELRMGAVGASSGIAKGEKYGMRSLTGQAASGIPVNRLYRHGVGFWFADTEIKIPNAIQETETIPEDLPLKFDLHQNYPNPFNPSTNIEYDIPVAAHVTIEVFNILGQRIALLVNELQTAGIHKVTWNGKGDADGPASSGVYLYRIVADRFVKTRTMTLVK